MDLNQRLTADLHDAMRSGDTARRSMIRMLLSAIHYEEVERGGPLDDKVATEVLRREAKKRQEALVLFRQGGRADLVETTEGELAIISEYLPEQLSADEVEQMAREVIAELGASDPRQLGQVMKVLVPRVGGRADGKIVSETVRRLLAEGH